MCSLCDKSFSNSRALLKHKRRMIHSDRRPYHCPYCVRRFVTYSDLEFHVRCHTDVKPYACRHCSEYFSTYKQLKTHLLMSQNEGTCTVCNICQYKHVVCCLLRYCYLQQ